MNLFLSALILTTSFSLRTPKVGNETDWQFLFGAEKPKTYLLSVEEERDSGKRYSNESYWVRKDFKDPYWGTSYFVRERYVAIESRDIFYNQIEVNYIEGSWYGGYALRHVDSMPSHRLTGGYEVDRMIAGLVRMRLSAGMNTNLKVVDYNISSDFSFAFFKYISIDTKLLVDVADDKKYKQFKIGISAEIPQGD